LSGCCFRIFLFYHPVKNSIHTLAFFNVAGSPIYLQEIMNFMYKRLFKFAVSTITILTINLVSNLIVDYLVSYKQHYQYLKFTLIAMGIIVVIFYPLFTWMETWLNVLSVKIIRTGKSMAGKYFGLLLAFALSIAVLTYCYTRYWYHIDPLVIFLKKLG